MRKKNENKYQRKKFIFSKFKITQKKKINNIFIFCFNLYVL